MLFFVIQQIILSLILIAIVHYIYEFFKNNLTEPKIKDLVNKPKEKYAQIYNSVTATNNEHASKNMKNELQDYLKELSEKSNEHSEPACLLPEQTDNLFNNNYETL